MNNQALQALIDEYGDRINIIVLDNVNRIYVGYPEQPIKSIADVELRTIGGVDFMIVPLRSGGNPIITSKSFHPTENIQAIYIVDDEYKTKLIDPLRV